MEFMVTPAICWTFLQWQRHLTESRWRVEVTVWRTAVKPTLKDVLHKHLGVGHEMCQCRRIRQGHSAVPLSRADQGINTARSQSNVVVIQWEFDPSESEADMGCIANKTLARRGIPRWSSKLYREQDPGTTRDPKM